LYLTTGAAAAAFGGITDAWATDDAAPNKSNAMGETNNFMVAVGSFGSSVLQQGRMRGRMKSKK